MIRFTERDMADDLAGMAHIIEQWNGISDHALVLRRMHDFVLDGLSANALGEAVASSGHSDPTVAAALNHRPGDDVNLVQVAVVHRWATRVLERALAPGSALTRPTIPPKPMAEATDTAFDSTAVFRPGAGTCDACGREYPGGKKRSERVHPCDGRMLCYSHLTGRKSASHAGRTIDAYIASVQTWMTTNGISQGADLDHHGGDAA